jgi:hypothetical protein
VIATTLADIRIHYHYCYCKACRRGRSPGLQELGIRSRTSPLLEEFAILLGADRPFARAGTLLRTLVGGSPLSASTVMRRTEQAGREVQAMEPEQNLSERWELTSQDTLVASVDGCMVNTREQGWKEVKAGVIYALGSPRRHYLAHLGGPGPLGSRLRQALVSLHGGQAGRHVAVGDGAPWIWNLFRVQYPAAEQVLDYYHAAEQIHACGNALYGEATPKAARWSKRMKTVLWEQGASSLRSRLRPSRFPRGKQQAAARALLRYVRNHQERMNYPAFRERGLPQGSGMVESACKTLVLGRLRLAGCRWNARSAEELLAVRSVVMSGQWERFTASRYAFQVPSN